MTGLGSARNGLAFAEVVRSPAIRPPAQALEAGTGAPGPTCRPLVNSRCSIDRSETASSSPLLLEKRAAAILVSQAGASIAYDNARDVSTPITAPTMRQGVTCTSIPDQAARIPQGVCLLRHFLWGWEGVAHASDALRWGRRIVEWQPAHLHRHSRADRGAQEHQPSCSLC